MFALVAYFKLNNPKQNSQSSASSTCKTCQAASARASTAPQSKIPPSNHSSAKTASAAMTKQEALASDLYTVGQ